MTKKMKRAVSGALLIFALGLVSGCGSNNEKMGYVDTNKVIQQSAKYKEIMGKLEERGNAIRTRLQEAEANQTPEEFQKTSASAQQEFSLYRAAMYKELQNYVESNVSTIAKEKKLTIVIDKNAVTSGGVDITEDLMKKMETTTTTTESAKTESSGQK